MTYTAMEKANMELVRKFFEVGPSKGDIEAADACLDTELSLHVPFPTTGSGIETINNIVKDCRAAFHGLYVTIEDMTADGDKVTCRFISRGVHNGAFMGLPPTGKSIALTGIEIFRLKNGRIAEIWGEANLMGLMLQLNIPMPSS
jgi:Predicted ester cyclase